MNVPPLIRIFSDLHFGDRASSLQRLDQLRPLFDGVGRLVLNGDTLDTRPGPAPEHTAAIRAEVSRFFAASAPPTTFVTGNHDPEFAPDHFLTFAADAVLVIHGDILFDNIVPWSNDASRLAAMIAAEFARLPPAAPDRLETRLGVLRRVAFALPQRHHSERRQLRYLLRYLADTVWPPSRFLKVIDAWRTTPPRAENLVRRHRPGTRFIVTGHTHYPGVWRRPSGLVVVNTGSFCLPLGACCVDLTASALTVRRIERRGGTYHPGRTVAAFPLAPSADFGTTAP